MANPAHQQPGCPHRVGGSIQMVQCLGEQRPGWLDAAGLPGRNPCPQQQIRPVQPAQLLRVWHLVPQGQALLVVPVGLGKCAHLLCGAARDDEGRQGPGSVTGRLPVGGQFSGGHRRGAISQPRPAG